MFIEPLSNRNKKRGWIEVITGSMFSGKTEELIRRLRRVQIAGQKVEIFKPAIDRRYDEIQIVSHDEKAIHSTPVEGSHHILMYAGTVDVVGIDEVQFFDVGVVEVAEKLASNGIRVICAGLDMDFLGKPFGPIANLLAIADYITKVHAICMKCGDLATHSFRKVDGQSQVLLGEKGEYEPRCRVCWNEGMRRN